MKLRWFAAFACTGLAYCGGGGGGSGVDSGKTIGSLSDSEVQDFCEYVVDLSPSPPRTIECDGVTLHLGHEASERDAEIADCTAEIGALDACEVTVGTAESCVEGNASQLAGLSDDEICAIAMGGTAPEPPAACDALEDPTCNEEPPA